MRELTPCNRCVLERMKDRATRKGVTLSVFKVTDDYMRGWIAVQGSDEDKPSVYFMALSDGCEC